MKVRSPGVPEGRDGQKSMLGTPLVYTRLRSRKRHLQPGRFARPASGTSGTSVDLSIKWTALEVDSVVEWIRLLRGIDWYSTDRVT